MHPMHPDHILMLHRLRTRETVARAEHLRHLRAARRDSRPRGALSRLFTRASPRQADRASPIETGDAPDSGFPTRGGRDAEPVVAPIVDDEIGSPIEETVC